MQKSAKDYVDEIAEKNFEKLSSFVEYDMDFYQFLTSPCKDRNVKRSLVTKLTGFGIPKSYMTSANKLHYLVVAVKNRATGNG